MPDSVAYDLASRPQGDYRETDRGHARGTGCDHTEGPVPLFPVW